MKFSKAFLRQKKEKLSLSFFTKANPARKRRRTSLLSQSTSSAHTRTTVCNNYGCVQVRDQLKNLQIENADLKTKTESLETELKLMKDELNNSRTSALSQHLSQIRVKGSQTMVLNSDDNSLFVTTGEGAQVTYSLRMMLLGLSLLILNNCPSRQIPDVLNNVFQSAGFDQPRLPKFNFFRRLRFMLPNLNNHLILLFLSESVDLLLGFDETSYSTRMGSILGMTMTNENGKSILIGLLENEKRSLIRGEKSTFDAEAIIDYLKELCGGKFRETVAKISCILTDNCNTATAGSEKLARLLDKESPLPSPRRSIRCIVHLCALLEKHAMRHLPLLASFANTVAYHLCKPSGQAKDNLFHLWERKSSRRFKHSTGERFFFVTDNTLVSFLDFDKLFSFVTENKSNSNGAKQIHELMMNKDLEKQMLIMSGLATLIRELWKTLTVKQKKQLLSDKIEKLKENVNSLRSGDVDILQLIEDANIRNKLTVTSREMLLNKSSEDTANDVKIIYIDIINKMMPYLNQFLIVEEGTENHQIEPSNVPVERAFGIFKFIEKLLVNLQFGLISATTIAKFNHLPNELETYDSDIIWKAHSQISKIEKDMKSKHIEQENFRVQHAESMRNEVNSIEPVNKTFLMVL